MAEKELSEKQQARLNRISNDLEAEFTTLDDAQKQAVRAAFPKYTFAETDSGLSIQVGHGKDNTVDVKPATMRELSTVRSFINRQTQKMKPHEQVVHSHDVLVAKRQSGVNTDTYDLGDGVTATFSDEGRLTLTKTVEGTTTTLDPAADTSKALITKLQGKIDEELHVGKDFIGGKNIGHNKGPIALVVGAALAIPNIVREVTGSGLAQIATFAAMGLGALNFIGKLQSGEVVRPELFRQHEEGAQVNFGDRAKDFLTGSFETLKQSFNNLDGLQHLAHSFRQPAARGAGA